MTDESTTVTLPDDAPTAAELLMALRGGGVDLVRRLLSEDSDLATARFERRGAPRRSSETSREFLRPQASGIAACDFLRVYIRHYG